MAEGVGLLPTIGKALKINERFRRYVYQDYRLSVTSAIPNPPHRTTVRPCELLPQLEHCNAQFSGE
jgi:hypothetical protein